MLNLFDFWQGAFMIVVGREFGGAIVPIAVIEIKF